ncbi:MAG TPA: winged helix-turn-helix domain-containing protein [Terriglobales bacterium]
MRAGATFARLYLKNWCYTPLQWEHENGGPGAYPECRWFGPFELFVETGELRKDGVRLKLSGQPIQLLARLVAAPGKLVTREELQQELWHGSSYGDFEKGLNAAVNRLREYLGDSATEPKYIETIPRRGYRFIGELEPGTTLGPQPAELDVAVPTKSKGLRNLVIAATLAVAVVASATYFYFRRPAKFMEKDTLVIADFDNRRAMLYLTTR